MKKQRKAFFKTPWGIAVLCVALLLVVLISLRFGSVSLSTKRFYGGLFGKKWYETETVILYAVRLPRVLGAVLAGVGLSVSGVLLQNVTGNMLAGPNIIGVNSGAGICVICLIAFAPAAIYAMPFVALAGAIGATFLILAVASRVQASDSAVVLAGIAVTTLLSAVISLISLLDNDVLIAYNDFAVGGLSGVTFEKLIVPSAFILIAFVAALVLSGRTDALCLGDRIAASLGVRVKPLRTGCLILASVSAAAVVSFAGLLGFVGLVVPHIARRLCGGKTALMLPVSALLGGCLVTLADFLGRIIFAPSGIPVGIIMALIGAPFFFLLLLKKRKHYDRIS